MLPPRGKLKCATLNFMLILKKLLPNQKPYNLPLRALVKLPPVKCGSGSRFFKNWF